MAGESRRVIVSRHAANIVPAQFSGHQARHRPRMIDPDSRERSSEVPASHGVGLRPAAQGAQVVDLIEAPLLEQLKRALAAHAALAVQDRGLPSKCAGVLVDLTERQVHGTGKMTPRELVGLAHVDQLGALPHELLRPLHGNGPRPASTEAHEPFEHPRGDAEVGRETVQ